MLRDTFDNDTVRKGCPDNNAVSKGVARFDTTDGEDKDSTLQEELKPVTQSAGLLQDEAFLCAYCNAALETKKYSSIGCQLTGSLTNNSPDKCELCLLFSRARVAEDGDQKDNHLEEKPNADLGSDTNSEGAESLEELDELESDSELSERTGISWDIGDCLEDIVLYSNNKECLSLTGWIRAIPESQIDWNLIGGWISECETQHGTSCNTPTFLQKSFVDVPFILIDVRSKCLVERSTKERYVALSYVWGEVNQFLCTEANYTSLCEEGALENHNDLLSRVIKDAITAVIGLGERYLWVDTLCIIQDGKDKGLLISHMASIYNAALLTIIAVDAFDADSGLPGVNIGSREMAQGVREAGILICKKRDESTIYRSRGWTYQEVLLSRRQLYISNQQVTLRCQKYRFSEDRQRSTSIETDTEWMSMIPREVSLENYFQLVETYTGRVLRYNSDRLRAFSGILGALESSWNWAFTNGLPNQYLHDALLWFPVEEYGFEALVHSMSAGLSEFPSWSWASPCGEVSFAHALAQIQELRHIATLDCGVKDDKEDQLQSINTSGLKMQEHGNPSTRNHNTRLDINLLTESQPLNQFELGPFPHYDKLEEAIEEASVRCLPVFTSEGVWCGLFLGVQRSDIAQIDSTERLSLCALSSYRCKDGKTYEFWSVGGLGYMLKQPFDLDHYSTGAFATVNVMLVMHVKDAVIRLAIGEIHKQAWDMHKISGTEFHLV